MWRSRLYDPIKELGQGYQSVVWLARAVKTGQLVAIKTTNIRQLESEKAFRYLSDETFCLRTLSAELEAEEAIESNNKKLINNYNDDARSGVNSPNTPSSEDNSVVDISYNNNNFNNSNSNSNMLTSSLCSRSINSKSCPILHDINSHPPINDDPFSFTHPEVLKPSRSSSVEIVTTPEKVQRRFSAKCLRVSRLLRVFQETRHVSRTLSQPDDSLFFVLEYIEGLPLNVHIRKEKGLSEGRARFHVAELVRILGALHERGFLYRDLKASNVLIEHNGRLRLVDFGMTKYLPSRIKRSHSYCGTVHAMAPEVLCIDERNKRGRRKERVGSCNDKRNVSWESNGETMTDDIDCKKDKINNNNNIINENHSFSSKPGVADVVAGCEAEIQPPAATTSSNTRPIGSLLPTQGSGVSQIKQSATPSNQADVQTSDHRRSFFLDHHRQGYGREVDWWGLGVLTYEMIYGRPPFGFRDFELDSEKSIFDLSIHSPESIRHPEDIHISNELKEFMHALLQADPKLRLGYTEDAVEVQGAVWFDGFPWSTLDDWNHPGPEVHRFRTGSDEEKSRQTIE